MPSIPSLSALRALGALGSSERRLLAEAAAFLAVSRLLVILVPFRWLAPVLARKASPKPLENSPTAPATTGAIARAVSRAARHVPWNAVCLPQAMAAKAMLRRRGIDAELHLGAGFDPAGKLIAHAWLVSDGSIVLGGDGVAGIAPLARFG